MKVKSTDLKPLTSDWGLVVLSARLFTFGVVLFFVFRGHIGQL